MSDSMSSSGGGYNPEMSLNSASRNNLLTSFYGLSIDNNNNNNKFDHTHANISSVTNTVSSTATELFNRPNKSKQAIHSTNIDTHNIDTIDFKSDQYVSYLSEQYDIKQLVDIDNKLMQSTIKLDNELQNLVYENYSQFIDFTEKIGKMNQNVSIMENYSKSLIDNINTTQAIENNIQQSTQQYITEYNNVHGINQLLKKLNFIYLLPNKLKYLIENQQYWPALQYYNKSCILFKQYSKYKSLDSIKHETDTMIHELYNKLKILVRDPTLNELYELQYIVLLHQLNQTITTDNINTVTLIYDMLHKKKQQFIECIDGCNEDGNNLIDRLQQQFIQPFVLFYSRYIDIFTIREPVSNNTRRQSNVADVSESVQPPLYYNEFNQFTNELFDSYFAKIKASINKQIGRVNGNDIGADTFSEEILPLLTSIETIHDQLQTMFSLNSSIVQRYNILADILITQLIDNLYHIIDVHIQHLLQSYEPTQQISPQEVTALTQQINKFIIEFVYTAYDKINNIIVRYQLNTRLAHDKSIFTVLHINLQHDLPNKQHKINIQPSSNTVTQYTNPMYFLLISQFVKQYTKNELPQQFKQFSTIYQHLNTSHIRQQFDDVYSILVEHYVELHSNNLTALLYTIITQQYSDKVQSVSQSMLQYINQLNIILADQIQPFYSSSTDTHQSTNKKTTNLGIFSNQQNKNIQKLFQPKLYTFTNESITNSEQFINYIQKIVLKNLLEYCRLVEYTTDHITKQIQIDMKYYVSQRQINTDIQYLIDEILHCVHDRNMESGVLLSDTELDTIVKQTMV